MFEFQEEADELLQQIIPFLNNFSHISGGEGTVYFIDDNFVVKKFFNDTIKSEKNQQTLIKHCGEVNRLSMQGYAIPRVYSVLLPEKAGQSAYLLEERAKGSSIFPTDHFENIVGRLMKKRVARLQTKMVSEARLQEELLSEFRSNFLTANEQLEALPDSEVEKFIMTDYYMTRDFKYGTPDVVKSNVIFDGNTLTHIDSYFAKEDSCWENGEVKGSTTPPESVLKDMADLMFYNGDIQKTLYKMCKENPEAIKLIKQNRRLVKENLIRFIRKTNSLISPKFDDDYKHIIYDLMVGKMRETLNSNNISDVTKYIERE